MAGKRILVFGVTGTEKEKALTNFSGWCSKYKSAEYTVVDFEKEYLFNTDKGGAISYNFLDSSQTEQCRTWSSVWALFCDDLEKGRFGNVNNNLLISMHGCIVRGYYGVRSILKPWEVAKLRPHRIIALVDNIYDMWWRTQYRARDLPYRGIPTLEQLLLARRIEIIIADLVAYSDGATAPVPHLVISVAHPCETVWNWISSPSPKVVYLCFPISAPRDMMRSGDPSGKSDVNHFLREAYKCQQRNPDLVLICPLGIDELPLTSVMGDASCEVTVETKEGRIKAIEFDRESLRWDMGSIWPLDTCLCPGPLSVADRKPIPVEQLRVAEGMIKTDVGWRDFRLVDQAMCLAAFNPKFRNRDALSRSVYREMTFAAARGCPVFVYQDPDHDPGNIFERYFPPVGTMGRQPGELMIVRRGSVDALFESIKEA